MTRRDGQRADKAQRRVLPLLALLLLLPRWAVQAADVSVAFIGSLSGTGANMAQDQLDGFRLGVKDLGGRLGGIDFAWTVVDDHQNPQQALLSFQRSSGEAERIHFLLLSSALRDAALLAPITAKARTFVIDLAAPAEELAGKGCLANFFSLSATADQMNEIFGQYLKGQGYHKLVMAGPGTAAAEAASAAFQRGFKGQLVPIVSGRGAMNFRADLKRLREAAPDGVYLLHTGGMAVEFLLQFAEAGLKGDLALFGPATTLDQTLLAATGPAAVDAFSVSPWSEDLDSPANHRLMSEFEGDYGRPASYQAALGYDAAMLIDAALHAADKKMADEDALRMALRRVDYPSTRGTVHFDSNHFPIQSYLLRQVVEDSRGRLINEQRGVLVRDLRDGHASECPMRWMPAETVASQKK